MHLYAKVCSTSLYVGNMSVGRDMTMDNILLCLVRNGDVMPVIRNTLVTGQSALDS